MTVKITRLVWGSVVFHDAIPALSADGEKTGEISCRLRTYFSENDLVREEDAIREESVNFEDAELVALFKAKLVNKLATLGTKVE